MGIKSINPELCNGCRVCVDDCPVDVIRMNEDTEKAYVAYPGDCVCCLQCEEVCPENAIELTVELVRPLWYSY